MDRYVAGVPRESLPTWVQAAIAEFRFVPLVGSSIERKHALVKVENHLGLGPVRVSLANRLPQFEAQLRRDPSSAEPFCECFARVRTIMKIPALLGFEEHPALSLYTANAQRGH